MEIKIDLDLPSIIAQAVSADRIQPIVDKAVTETITSAVRSATDYSSDFRKALEAQLKEAMPHGLDIGDVAKFQLMANAAVAETVKGANAETIQAAISAGLKNVIPDVPARIKLSELMKLARDGFHKEEHEAFYAHFERTDYGYGHLYLDSDADQTNEHRANLRIDFNKQGEVYAAKIDGRDITPNSIPKAIGKFDGLLLSMYVGRTSLEVDIDEDDVESLAQEQCD